jgi:L-malate glycosyltransferase
MPQRVPIKIAFFTGGFNFGGTERYLYQLVKNLDRGIFDPVIMCIEKKGELLPEFEKLNTGIHVFPHQGSFFTVSGIKVIFRASAFLRENRVEILHTLANWSTFLGVPAGRLACVPAIIASQRNMGHWMDRRKYSVPTGFIYRHLIQGVLVNAHAIKNRLIREFHIRQDRIKVIHNGISVKDSVRAGSSNDKNGKGVVAGFIGRFHRVKGLDLLIAAAGEIVRVHPDTTFLIVGDGSDRTELEGKVQKRGLVKNFKFVGYQEDVPAYLDSMDFLVLPSRAEGFPNIVLEAMARGKPVVAARVGGVPELVVDGGTGFLVDSHDFLSMARAAGKLIRDADLRKRMGLEAFKRAKENFDLKKMIIDHQDYYLELAGQCRGQSLPAISVAGSEVGSQGTDKQTPLNPRALLKNP